MSSTVKLYDDIYADDEWYGNFTNEFVQAQRYPFMFENRALPFGHVLNLRGLTVRRMRKCNFESRLAVPAPRPAKRRLHVLLDFYAARIRLKAINF